VVDLNTNKIYRQLHREKRWRSPKQLAGYNGC